MIDEVCFSTALLEGAKEVFETMIFMDFEEPSEPDEQIEGDSFLGSITFTNGIEGCLAIRCSVPCAKNIAANMLGIDTPDEVAEEEVCDALGEVTNMVMGSVKSRIQAETGELLVSIPTVIRGQNLASSLGNRMSKVFVKVDAGDEEIIEFSFLYREGDK
jgi:chemotaxis protein CheX